MFEMSVLIMIVGIMLACGVAIALDAYFNSLNRKRKYKVGCHNCAGKCIKTN